MSLWGTRRSDGISATNQNSRSSGLDSEESDCPLVANMQLLLFMLVDAFVAALLKAIMLRRNLVYENIFLIFVFCNLYI